MDSSTTVENVRKQFGTIIEVTMNAKKNLEIVQSQIADLENHRDALFVEIEKLREEKKASSSTETGHQLSVSTENSTAPMDSQEKEQQSEELEILHYLVTEKEDTANNESREDALVPSETNNDTQCQHMQEDDSVAGSTSDLEDEPTLQECIEEEDLSQAQVSILSESTFKDAKWAVVRAKRRRQHTKYSSPKTWRRIMRTQRLKSFNNM